MGHPINNFSITSYTNMHQNKSWVCCWINGHQTRLIVYYIDFLCIDLHFIEIKLGLVNSGYLLNIIQYLIYPIRLGRTVSVANRNISQKMSRNLISIICTIQSSFFNRYLFAHLCIRFYVCKNTTFHNKIAWFLIKSLVICNWFLLNIGRLKKLERMYPN